MSQWLIALSSEAALHRTSPPLRRTRGETVHKPFRMVPSALFVISYEQVFVFREKGSA